MSRIKNTVDWVDGRVCLIDQTKIPEKYELVYLDKWQDVAKAITNMVVRGAPAIGVTAALGMALAVKQVSEFSEFASIGEKMKEARPTAVNLMWAVDRIVNLAKKNSKDINKMKKVVIAEAVQMITEDINVNRSIGKYGAEVVPKKARILTHCNAGALATVGYGTALGVIRAAYEQGKVKMVYADETRPRL
ncbi:MAG: S-methyl-5-thioribose-1-phosphate isomerase, partial [Candidatus Margulisbacteria bacterium]|nr:S-methyl-5-thioribose-1-phosphate isomerase [Candidatus Margulisiibacteriota bacterium]